MSEFEYSPVLQVHAAIQDDNIYSSVRPVLQRIRPEWYEPLDSREAELDAIHMKVFSGGITNKLVGFYVDKDEEDIVIVKMYGEKTEMFIDREQEIRTMQLLHERKCGPTLYAIFQNGIAYQYSPGAPLDAEDVRHENIYSIVAQEMAKLHSISLGNGDKTPRIWKLLNNFDKLSQDALARNSELGERLEAVGLDSGWPRRAIDELKNLCDQESMPIGFCHNDLLLGNIIYDEKRNHISFIDFEYAAANYTPFDVANHFNEFAGVDDCDYSRFPDEDFQREWIRKYLEHAKLQDSAVDVEKFLSWVRICVPLSHLLWIVWSILQACYSTIDFDFVNYIALRLPEFNKSMEKVRA